MQAAPASAAAAPRWRDPLPLHSRVRSRPEMYLGSDLDLVARSAGSRLDAGGSAIPRHHRFHVLRAVGGQKVGDGRMHRQYETASVLTVGGGAREATERVVGDRLDGAQTAQAVTMR